MADTLDLAMLAGASYFSTRTAINRFPIPAGWLERLQNRDSDAESGFEARAFQSGNEIVISYAGTYTKQNADLIADIKLGTGFMHAQLLQAVEYYLQIKSDPANAGKTIALTGHSLGGGLAALVGVFFGVSATAFDEAPFAQTALFQGEALKAYLVGKVNAGGSRIYSDAALAPLTSYIEQKATFGASPTIRNKTKTVITEKVDELLNGKKLLERVEKFSSRYRDYRAGEAVQKTIAKLADSIR